MNASSPTCLKTTGKRAASTVNAHLTALDHFYEHLGLGAVRVRRDQLPRHSPKALGAREQKRYLRSVEARPLARDRARRGQQSRAAASPAGTSPP